MSLKAPDLFALRRDATSRTLSIIAALGMASLALAAVLTMWERAETVPPARAAVHPAWLSGPTRTERGFSAIGKEGRP